MLKSTSFFLLLISVLACVEPYDFSLQSNTNILSVNAILTDKDSIQRVIIVENKALNGIVYNEEIPNLKVQLVVNNSEKISLVNEKKGEYYFPKNFKILPENTYKLVFEKPDGTLYESTNQSLPATTKIDKIYDDFVLEGKEHLGKKLPSNFIYVDFTDVEKEKNNYVWQWTLWERQYFCSSIFEFDIYCKSDCWEMLHNETYETYSDVLSNGKAVKGKLLAQIPYYNYHGSLLEVRQLNVSAEALKYFNIFNQQAFNTGTLADVPPAPLIGNIRNVNDLKEAVTGIFTIASVDIKKYWLSRQNAEGKAKPVGLLFREPNPHPFYIFAPCEESFNRTPKRPVEWQD